MRRDDVVAGRDAAWVAAALEGWDRTRGLSLRGRTPAPPMVGAILGGAAMVQQAIWDDRGQPAALLQIADVRDGAGELNLLADPAAAPGLASAITGFLFDVFERHDLRKLTAWVLEDELNVPAYLPMATHPVGRLVAHDRRGPDKYVDLLIYEIWKDDMT